MKLPPFDMFTWNEIIIFGNSSQKVDLGFFKRFSANIKGCDYKQEATTKLGN
jgi:hypothetical protein